MIVLFSRLFANNIEGSGPPETKMGCEQCALVTTLQCPSVAPAEYVPLRDYPVTCCLCKNSFTIITHLNGVVPCMLAAAGQGYVEALTPEQQHQVRLVVPAAPAVRAGP
jgi:hypothetical protein